MKRVEGLTLSRSKDKMDKDKEWYFYIVRCKDNSLYSGIAIDINDRVREHNRGTGAKYTLARRPVNLVYSEKQGDASKARKRESQTKSWSKIKKENLIKGFPRLRSE